MRTKVYITKRNSNESPQELVIRTLIQIPLKTIITNSESSILIKPNWVTSDNSKTGNVTSTDTLEGIVSYLIEDAKISPDKVIVADGGSYSTNKTMELNNIFKLQEFGVRVANLNDDDMVNNIIIREPLSLKSVNMAKTAIDASCIISVPSLKTHNMAKTTLSLKNMMGCISPKGIMHSNLHQKIADLVSLLRHKMKFQIIDGIIGSSGSELGGKPIRMDLIIAGEDPVAVDRIGSEIIGYSLDKVKYLKFCEEKGLGITNLDKIEIIGDSINDVFCKF